MRLPGYRKHSSGQARVTLNGRTFYLGKYGSKESKQEYHRLCAEYVAGGGNVVPDAAKADLVVAELFVAYLAFAGDHYGQKSSELVDLKLVIRRTLELYSRHAVAEFKCLQLEAVRQGMVDAGMSRTYINEQVRRLVRIFKWGVTRELVPESIAGILSLLEPLKKGRTKAPEPKPVMPVDSDIVDATLAFLPPVVKDLVTFQRLVGARPGEACGIKPCMVDRTGDVWEIRLKQHKTDHKGKARTLYAGPAAQAVLAPYLARDADAFCFSPRDSEKRRREAQHAARTTPLSCGNRPGSNREAKPKRSPRDHYDKDSYRQAIHRACDRAFPVPDGLSASEAKTWKREHRWNPNQLRHSAGTEIRREAGIETARVILGHSSASTTEIYAETDRQRAIDYARKAG